MRKIILGLIIVCVNFFSANAQLVINEYSAANYDTHSDNYTATTGKYNDWLELYNPTSTEIDIAGWYLSDKVSEPTKWMVPSSFIVPANGHAIIYCSGKDEVSDAFAHTNFKITQTKENEVLLLTDGANILQDSIRVLPSQNSHSRGRETDGASNWKVFTIGTPNSNNVGAMQEYAITPTFSQSGGYNNGPFNLTLSSPDPSIVIYFTINGDEPSNTSDVYTAPIEIDETKVVKAISYSTNNNVPPSFIDYHTFFVNDTHSIPILSISGGQVDNLLNGNAGLRPRGTMEWFDSSGNLLDKGTGEYNRHGNDSWAYAQRGFDYIMRDQFGYNYALKDKLFETKERDKFQRIIVKSAANDNYPFSFGGSGAHIRDSYINHLSQLADLKLDERSYAPCVLYLNGEYWGLYDIREKVDDPDFLDYYYDQDEKYKNNPEYIQYLKYWGAISTEYGGANAESDWLALKNYIINNPMDDNTNYQTVKNQLNTGSLIDYFILNSYVVAADWLNYNTGWWRGLDPNGDKKKWRYELWDMDNTFGHGTNYTGIPNQGPDADPCDPDDLPDPGGQWSQVPIWNSLQENSDFFDDYINRWQDLANGYFSCDSMLAVLNKMINIIDPEMDRQIQTWGGNKPEWLANVDELRDYIAQRCTYMNTGFVPCYPALSGPFNVTVEIIGVGEVEMSNNNSINNNNTPFSDERFGGINLPFNVISGAFAYWEIVSATPYAYDPNIDTLSIDLQGDIIIKAYFGELKNIVLDVVPTGTATSIDINGNLINIFPYTSSFLVGENISLNPTIDPLYAFDSWSSDSNIILPNPLSEIISFNTIYDDTIDLNLYQKPNVVYTLAPIGTNTSVDINGINISVFPHSETVFVDDLNTMTPYIDPSFSSGMWSSSYNTLLNGNMLNNSFYGIYSDTLLLTLTQVTAFIAGNDTICNNDKEGAKVSVAFNGVSPFTFIYSINGISQSPITTTSNPHIITTKKDGEYTLISYNDANQLGEVDGQALVTILPSPKADFVAQPDSMTVLFTTTQLVDKSIGNIFEWIWDFGDNTANEFIQNPAHTYQDSINLYQVSLIVTDSLECSDTTQKLITISNLYSIYIPNSFTPDLDGVNDNFCLSYNGIRDATFRFNVYDRFSNLVYATDNIYNLTCPKGWGGVHYKTGVPLPMGTYIYQIYYQDFEGWKYHETSEIKIIR